ncbi:MAG: pyrroline-5-carboxylate reductase [Blautia sp.]
MKLGFAGCGNMAGAIIGGILEKGIVSKEEIKASTKTEDSAARVRKNLGISCGTDNREAVRDADVVFLAVKPQFCEGVIKEIKEEIKENQVIISIVAGKKLEWLEEQFGKSCKIIRTMPNTPALVGEGITGVCPNSQVTENELEEAMVLLRSFGRADTVSETILDVVGAVSGSSPAFVFLFIEAMADGAVAEGMPRKQAYEFAAQAVYGSAKMVLETGMHPGELKDMVCSPAGTTIEGIGILEEKGMRSAVIESVRACVKKTRQL